MIFTRRCVIILANFVRQIDALSAVIQAVSKATGCKVYSDEVLEKFKKPCFFVSVSSRMTPYTDNVVEKELTIALTYFPRDNEKNEITYWGLLTLFNASSSLEYRLETDISTLKAWKMTVLVKSRTFCR